jgi:hypothetical protein
LGSWGYQRFGSRAAVARLYHVGSKGLAEGEGFEPSIQVSPPILGKYLLWPYLPLTVMQFVAASTKGQQVLFKIRSGVAPELNVVNLEIPHSPTFLTSPVVSLEYLPVESRVIFRFQF